MIKKTVRYSEIGKRLRQLRGDLSQSAFAKSVDATLRAYQYYEAGERVPHIHLLTKIANLYNTTTDWILTGEMNIEKARTVERSKRSFFMKELLDQLEASLIREERLLYRAVKEGGENEGIESLSTLEENKFIQWLRNYIQEEQAEEKIVNIDDIPKENIKEWLDSFWEKASSKQRAWLEVEFERAFPEYKDWLQKKQRMGAATDEGTEQAEDRP